MDKIIVDIDNTLWDLAPVLYARMREVNPDLPPPAKWGSWDFWLPYVSPTRFISAMCLFCQFAKYINSLLKKYVPNIQAPVRP